MSKTMTEDARFHARTGGDMLIYELCLQERPQSVVFDSKRRPYAPCLNEPAPGYHFRQAADGAFHHEPVPVPKECLSDLMLYGVMVVRSTKRGAERVDPAEFYRAPEHG